MGTVDVPPDTASTAWSRDAGALAAAGAPALGPDDLARLDARETFARRDEAPDGPAVLGAAHIPAPISAVWIAIQDGAHAPQPTLSVEWLTDDSATRRVHMVLELPFPLADRQWVAEFTPDRALWDATDGRAWQRAWRTGDPTAALHPRDGALWIDTRGTWTLVTLGERDTLAVFAARTAMGGLVPDGLSTRWAVSSLHDSMAQIADRAGAMPDHYDDAHDVVTRPDGAAVTPRSWPGSTTARR